MKSLLLLGPEHHSWPFKNRRIIQSAHFDDDTARGLGRASRNVDPTLATELTSWWVAGVFAREAMGFPLRVAECARFDTHEKVARPTRYLLASLA